MNFLDKNRYETTSAYIARKKEEARIKKFDRWTMAGISILIVGFVISLVM
jgi:hypothetical protein